MNKNICRAIFLLTICTILPAGALPTAADSKGSCPTPAAVQDLLTKTFQRQLNVKAVLPMETMGLCQVQVDINGGNQILYVDKTGRYLFLGQIVDTATRKNLTKTSLDQMNRFNQEEMKDLESLVAFSIGPEDAPNILYLVTDPQCPFCKRAEAVLEKLAEEGTVRTRFLFFPLPSHKGARETCISILCDQKGLAEFKSGYRSENQCSEGKEQVEKTLRVLQGHGIGGTPTYIFSDGSFHAGVLSREALLKRLQDLK